MSDDMRFSFEEMISQDETLMPGEFIGFGTVGNGCGLEIESHFEHGDEIEFEVEKNEVLRNPVEPQDACFCNAGRKCTSQNLVSVAGGWRS
jgi:2-keto-4-pentenoate hydratase/2-oxohepta-3-ene-1,7-dioic acid hydratase in catechol pathway